MAHIAKLTLRMDPEYLRYLQMQAVLLALYELAEEEPFSGLSEAIRDVMDEMSWLRDSLK